MTRKEDGVVVYGPDEKGCLPLLYDGDDLIDVLLVDILNSLALYDEKIDDEFMEKILSEDETESESEDEDEYDKDYCEDCKILVQDGL